MLHTPWHYFKLVSVFEINELFIGFLELHPYEHKRLVTPSLFFYGEDYTV